MQSRCIQGPWWKRLLLAFVLVGGLSGCGFFGWAYERAPTLVYWWLDGWLDFDATQGQRAQQALQEGFEWHRTHELPQFVALLGRAQQEVIAPITPEAVCQWSTVLKERANRFWQVMEPAAAAYLATTTPAQWAEMDKRMQRKHEQMLEERVLPDLAQRQEASLKRARQWAKRLYGRLETGQEAQLERMVKQSPFDVARWAQDRQERQKAFMRWLQKGSTEHRTAQEWQQGLRPHWEAVWHSSQEGYRPLQAKVLQYQCDALAQFHNTTTTQQRQHAAEVLGEWRSLFHKLSAVGGG